MKRIKTFNLILLACLMVGCVSAPLQTSAAKSNNTQAKTTNTAKEDLTTAAGIEKYLNEKYGKQSPLKTSLVKIPFSFSVKINKSKFEQYDILIDFNYDVKKVDNIIFENENSIDSLDIAKAANTQSQIKKFIETYAKDISSKLPTKKIKGQTDGSYYTYPNTRVGYNSYLRNVWVTYDFVDPNSTFADYYGNLAMYDETKVSEFKWAPEQQ